MQYALSKEVGRLFCFWLHSRAFKAWGGANFQAQAPGQTLISSRRNSILWLIWHVSDWDAFLWSPFKCQPSFRGPPLLTPALRLSVNAEFFAWNPRVPGFGLCAHWILRVRFLPALGRANSGADLRSKKDALASYPWHLGFGQSTPSSTANTEPEKTLADKRAKTVFLFYRMLEQGSFCKS